jgi:hypothetical protein
MASVTWTGLERRMASPSMEHILTMLPWSPLNWTCTWIANVRCECYLPEHKSPRNNASGQRKKSSSISRNNCASLWPVPQLVVLCCDS